MAFAHGKIILLGEHAVVFGKPAIVAAMDRGVDAVAERSNSSILAVDSWNLACAPTDAVGSDLPIAFAFGELLRAMKVPHPIAVRARVGLAAGAGLGCSAALGVAIVKAIDECNHVARTNDDVVELSLAWEKVFHGNPSGIDSAAAAIGGIRFFQKGVAPSPIVARDPLLLVVGLSGERASTKSMVDAVARQRERAPTRVDQAMDAIAALVTNAKMAIEHGKFEDLGKMMDLNHSLLASMMLSTAALEEMCAVARHAGAYGAKLTGSGGGGAMIALVRDHEIAARVESELRALGKESFTVRCGVTQ